ncbi:AI-2E family transporter [Croceiramulus getboli]|nr:AI-2E family transporter [Flavobacteriaceae bacterium YJPT1-3]
MRSGIRLLLLTLAITTGLYFFFNAIVKAEAFLAPLVTAIILSLALLPLTRYLEQRMKPLWSALLSTLVVFLISGGLVALVSIQVDAFIDDWDSIQRTMEPKVEQFKGFLIGNTPLTQEDLNLEQSARELVSGSLAPYKRSGNVALSLFGFVGSFLLCCIYVFFCLRYRSKFKRFLLEVFSNKDREKLLKTIDDSAMMAPKYIQGKLILMGLLAVLYSIGLGISGVNNFILVSLIAAALTLIPYIGNIIGFSLALALGYLTSGDLSVLIGIILTFTITQFVESYVLQPYVVGDQVDLHPLVVILVVIIGNLTWGVIGMVIAIPLTAVFVVFLLHVPVFREVGILLSNHSFDSKA